MHHRIDHRVSRLHGGHASFVRLVFCAVLRGCVASNFVNTKCTADMTKLAFTSPHLLAQAELEDKSRNSYLPTLTRRRNFWPPCRTIP